MRNTLSAPFWTFTCLSLLLLGTPRLASGESLIPADSPMSRPERGQQLVLVSPLTSVGGIRTAGWKMGSLSVAEEPALGAKVGASAVRFRGVAASSGAKGDFPVAGAVAGETVRLGMWVHVAADSNVATVGVQFGDSEGEQFLLKQDVDGTGWQWAEFDLTADELPQAWKQKDKNGQLDLPLRHVNIIWFAPAAGPSTFAVNGLFALTSEAGPTGPVLAMPGEFEPGQAMSIPLILTNPTDQTATYQIDCQLQRNSDLVSFQLPDPTFGTNHARGASAVTTIGGKEVERGSLTDPERSTSWRSDWGAGDTEVVQTVDLGVARRITRLEFSSGDANWAWKLDVSGSTDGKNWHAAPGLTGVSIRKKWNDQTLPLAEPFRARYLRLRHHNDGEKANSFSTPSDLRVYDGLADEKWKLPTSGETLDESQSTVSIPPRSVQVVPVLERDALETGAYLLSVRIRSDDSTQMLAEPVFVLPARVTRAQQAASPVAMNVSNPGLAPALERLGIGWVRFENLKWRMVTRERGVYKFDGLLPWGVDHDGYVKAWRDHGMKTLPYYFMSPLWASGLDKSVKHNASYPPKDFNDYGDGVFQLVARYGNVKHPSDELLTEDKLTGLGLLSVYELWNEPNLNNPSWGHWIGTLPEYYEMFRVGAEAAKRADPSAQVANGGYAGISLGLVDQLRTYTYADGKHPLDFVDVLSVHTYTGASAPEKSVVDTNVDRSGNTAGSVSHEERLQRLGAWRDQFRPGMKIWMTETGYDTAGPRGVTERKQAAYSVRNILMMLAGGVDKVFIFREKGSGNSLYAASGLLRNDGTFKPSYYTVATLIRQLDGATDITRLPHEDPNVYVYAWKRDGKWVLAAWSIDEAGDRTLRLPLGGVELTDSFGMAESVEDAMSLPLGEMPVYLTGLSKPSVVEGLVVKAAEERGDWLARRRKLASLKAYLFDFGADEYVGAAEIGLPRPFIATAGDVIYDRSKGYGFKDVPAGPSNDARWVKSPTHRDSVSVGSKHTFRVDVERGKYALTLAYRPKGPAGEVLVKTAAGAQTVKATRKDTQAELVVNATGGWVEFDFRNGGTVSFITLVEME